MRRLVCALAVLLAGWTPPAAAQTDGGTPSEPAFILSSGEIVTSREQPSFFLTFRNLRQLDFRVYKVRDAVAFFAGLNDPHQIGSPDAVVPTEPTWLERLTSWKRAQRSDIRRFVRSQLTERYLSERRAARDSTEVARRVALNQATFAQSPLLNPAQLVTSWREILPSLRDPEMRRLPLEVSDPGVYVVEAVSGQLRAYTVVVKSDIGLVTKVAPGQMLVFAANRLTGEPNAGCDVRVIANRQVVTSGTTGGDGTFSTSLPDVRSDTLVTVARCGDEVTVTDPRGYQLNAPTRQLLGYIYSDKPIYRPGQTAHIRAVLRWRDGDTLTPFDASTAEMTVTDINDKVIVRRSLQADAFGVVTTSFDLPAVAALGNYTVRVTTAGQQALGSFDVQEYRRPEFEVNVSSAARFVVQGQTAVAAVQARYYFGQPVANATAHYVVSRQSYFSPYRYSDGEEEAGEGYFGGEQILMGDLRLDAQGRGDIRVPTPVDEDGRDYSLRIEAQVTDTSGRQISNATTVNATYGTFMIVPRVDGYIFAPGQTVTATLRAVDYAGMDRPGVDVDIVLEHLVYRDGYYNPPTATRVRSTRVTLDGSGRGTVQLALGSEAGDYRITATATEGGRSITGQTSVWVSGSRSAEALQGDRYLELIADRRSYAPGDRARLVVRGEALEGPVLVSKEGQQITWHQVIRVGAETPLEVPIDQGDIGDIFVSVAYMRDGRLNIAERRLVVPAVDRTLQVSLTADSLVAKPQQPGTFTVRVVDAAGMPVRAQLSLGVIDEAVYAIAPDRTPDPVRFFYRREYSRVGTTFSRDYYFVGYAGSERLQLAQRRRRPFSLADFKGDKQVQPQVRKEFPDAIYWIGDLVTGADGTAQVSIRYPDALTTWRFTARAVTVDTRAGVAVSRTTTTKDLIVRVITPRFLTEGDDLILPTIVHNYLPEAKSTTVSLSAQNLQPAAGAPLPTPVTTSIAAGGERRDDWRLTADTVGTATVTATARTDADTDAVELPVPVLPMGLRRETGTSGTLFDAGEASAQVTIPAGANPAARTVQVSLAPSLAGSMLGALDFLTSYPYGCTEQTLSSFVPNLVVTRALAQLNLAPAARLTVLDRQVNDGLRRLFDLQQEDGGWGWWRSDASHPFMTAYSVYGLLEARREGVGVDGFRLQQGVRALAALYARYPRAVPDLKAYVVFVLGRAAMQVEGYTHGNALNDLWEGRARMSPYGRALLLLALDEARDPRGDELARTLAAEAQTQGELSFWRSDGDPLLGDFMDTSVEATATAVRALAPRDPRNPLLDRAMRWLMANRSGGYWYSTKQTAMALYGLLDLLKARNETPQPFTVDVFVNGAAAGSRTFTAASLTSPDPIVLQASAREGANDIRIVKRGGGTLYWSATGVYFDPRAAEGRSGSRQLAISRTYARLTPVRQQDGTFKYREQPLQGAIAPGDVLTVRLTVAGSPDWQYLAIEDPLPAGVEQVQDTSAYPLESGSREWWWYGPRVEYRDARTTFFLTSFDQGRYEFVYLVKAISSGEFTAIPAQITPMYVPGVAASTEPLTLTVSVPAGAAR